MCRKKYKSCLRITSRTQHNILDIVTAAETSSGVANWSELLVLLNSVTPDTDIICNYGAAWRYRQAPDIDNIFNICCTLGILPHVETSGGAENRSELLVLFNSTTPDTNIICNSGAFTFSSRCVQCWRQRLWRSRYRYCKLEHLCIKLHRRDNSLRRFFL